MKYIAAFILAFGLSAGAYADVWKWVDALGEAHFVDSLKPIYTWVDESDKVHYSDTPGHKDAFRVELVWHSAGSHIDNEDAPAEAHAFPGETDEEAQERETAEAYYCERATEILATVTGAQRLYDTNDAGERVYLSEEESAKTLAEAQANKAEWCP